MTDASPKAEDIDAGRMHVLDWLESGEFVPQLLAMVVPIGFTVSDHSARQPKGCHDSRETELVGRNEPFLSPEQQTELKGWWLKHKVGAKLPTWDLAVAALDAQKCKSLILVEAKAHATELSAAGKSSPKRKQPDEQKRSDENHERIATAIAEPNAVCRSTHPASLSAEITITNFQTASRMRGSLRRWVSDDSRHPCGDSGPTSAMDGGLRRPELCDRLHRFIFWWHPRRNLCNQASCHIKKYKKLQNNIWCRWFGEPVPVDKPGEDGAIDTAWRAQIDVFHACALA
jgi:hypothetical protein